MCYELAMKIAFAGGGSLGPVTPLLAVAKAIVRRKTKDDKIEFIWFGTPDGPEREIVEAAGMRFYPITVAKLPRYPDMRWLTFPFDLYKARLQAREILKKEMPNIVASVGGFTAVPVMREASRLAIPCAIHQLDVVMSWSNKAVEHLCSVRTTSFARDGYEQIPTPSRFAGVDSRFRGNDLGMSGNDKERKTILIVGGGTGASALNEAIAERLSEWVALAEIVHVTGKGKRGGLTDSQGYRVHEFLDESGMKHALQEADVVISRAGIGSLTDIASCSKAAILVPIPSNQQEENAKWFEETGVVRVVRQGDGFSGRLLEAAKEMLFDPEYYGDMVHAFFETDDGSALAERILKKI